MTELDPLFLTVDEVLDLHTAQGRRVHDGILSHEPEPSRREKQQATALVASVA
jgi:hypothetical protein